MTAFSRKKIRGFDRKLKQLDNWKKSIISCNEENLTKTNGQIFRIQLSPFYWYHDRNPHIKFHKHIYRAYFDILHQLKDNEFVRKNSLTVQLWLFYPRTVKSLVIVADKENYLERNKLINAQDTKKSPPRLFSNNFDSFRLKLGDDNVFEPIDSIEEISEWQTHRLGDIWTIE